MAKDGNEIPYASKCLIHHIDERLLVEPIKILCANESEFDEKRSGLIADNFDIVIIVGPGIHILAIM